VALPDDLQLHRCLPARDRGHPGDPGSVGSDRRASGLSGFFDLPDVPPAATLRLIIRTDGAAKGNPGPASSGAVLIDAAQPGSGDPLARPLATISEYLGVQTNNVAEYVGVVRALALALELGATEVDMLLDSKLIVEQVNGRWRVKDLKMIPLHAEVKASLGRFRRWSARHVPRAQNSAADALANEAIDRVRAGGPPVVVRRPDRA
jgi:ribonuclease HI